MGKLVIEVVRHPGCCAECGGRTKPKGKWRDGQKFYRFCGRKCAHRYHSRKSLRAHRRKVV